MLLPELKLATLLSDRTGIPDRTMRHYLAHPGKMPQEARLAIARELQAIAGTILRASVDLRISPPPSQT